MRKIWIFLLVVIILAGCGGGEQRAAGSGEAEAGVNATSPPSETPTITPSPFPIRTPTATSTPTKTPFPFSTPENGIFTEYSPNHEWGVWYAYDTSNNGNGIIVVNLNNPETVWGFYNAEKESDWVIDVGYQPIHWSIFGRYLYFTISWTGRDGWTAYQGFYKFKRMDLSTGNVIDMLPIDSQYQIGISPNSQHLAYVKNHDLTIRNLTNNSEETIHIDKYLNISSGNIRWAPDSGKLVFTMQNSDNWAIILINRDDLTYQILIENEEEIYTSGWDNYIKIIISQFQNKFILNTQTGEITEVEE